MLHALNGDTPLPDSFAFKYPIYLLGERSSLTPDVVANNFAGARFSCRVADGVVMLLVFTEAVIAWEYVGHDREAYFIARIDSAGHFASLLVDAISGGATHIAWDCTNGARYIIGAPAPAVMTDAVHASV